MWANGGVTGLDWMNVRTVPGLAFGTQAGNTLPPYNDSIAVLAGPWGANQTVTATVHAVNQQGPPAFEEVSSYCTSQSRHVAGSRM